MRDLDPTNDITFLRMRTKKNELLIAPGMQKYCMIENQYMQFTVFIPLRHIKC